MRDLDVAKDLLKNRNLSLIIVRDGKVIFESRLPGIAGLIQAIESMNMLLHSSSVADRIVGRAAALLLVYSHVSEVYALTMSSWGLAVLEEAGIRVEYDVLAPRILNRRGDDICPFEKISLTASSPDEAYKILKAASASFRT
jgi:hypothetical protein